MTTEAEILDLIAKARALRPELDDAGLARWLTGLADYIERTRGKG